MIVAIGIILIYIAVNYRSIYVYWFRGEKCALELKARDLKIDGIISEKFNDTNNHNYYTIKVVNKEKIDKIYFNDVEDSLLWKKMKVKDSIKKEENSLTYYLHNGNIRNTIRIKYNCKNQ